MNKRQNYGLRTLVRDALPPKCVDKQLEAGHPATRGDNLDADSREGPGTSGPEYWVLGKAVGHETRAHQSIGDNARRHR